MTTAEEDQIGELLRQAVADQPAAPGSPLAAASIKLGRRRLLRRRLLAAVVGVAVVTASPVAVRAWPNGGRQLAVIPASDAPSGTVPQAVDCRDRGGDTVSGTVDSATSTGASIAPAEQAKRWAQGSGADQRFPGMTVSGVAERGSGVVVALADADGIVRALLTFDRTVGGWRLAGISSC